MSSTQIQISIAMIAYISVVIGIGFFYAKKANESSENFFLGGRSLGPWVTAMSAEASDMSGWLLMGLPGLAYWSGLSGAFWTAIGLGVGTYINWLLVARRLRIYSHLANDSITVPDFMSHRYKETKPILLGVSAFFILIFFSIYASSCFVTVGKLFTTLFGLDYKFLMILGAAFVIFYTFIGGFLAESVSDFMQGIVMIISLVIITTLGLKSAGGLSNVIQNAQQIPGFFDFFGVATPQLENGLQVLDGVQQPVFGNAEPYSWLDIISTASWGLGYFGVPQVLLRFMAIEDPNEIKKSRRIATTWCFISLGAAVLIGLIGRVLFPSELLSASAAESVFINMSTHFLPPLLAGIVMSGILAATISSSDSYLLIASSAVAKNMYQGILKKDATDQQVMNISRIALLVISLLGIVLALDENSIIFSIVSFAWAGFGATFGPIILFSLFWRETTEAGAVAGMLGGGICVFVWKLLIAPMGGVFGIYELLPSFLVSCILIVLVSKMTTANPEVLKEYDRYQQALKN